MNKSLEIWNVKHQPYNRHDLYQARLYRNNRPTLQVLAGTKLSTLRALLQYKQLERLPHADKLNGINIIETWA